MIRIALTSESFRRAFCSGRFQSQDALHRAVRVASTGVIDRRNLTHRTERECATASWRTHRTNMGVRIETVIAQNDAADSVEVVLRARQQGQLDGNPETQWGREVRRGQQ